MDLSVNENFFLKNKSVPFYAFIPIALSWKTFSQKQKNPFLCIYEAASDQRSDEWLMQRTLYKPTRTTYKALKDLFKPCRQKPLQ